MHLHWVRKGQVKADQGQVVSSHGGHVRIKEILSSHMDPL